MALYSFKDNTQTRDGRTQNIEEKFGLGMQFTNNPMPEGWLRVIANMDIVDAGAALATRPGLQATQLYMPEDTSGAATIVDAKEQYVSATEHCVQLLTIEKRMDDGYDLRVITGTTNAVAHEPINNTLYDAVDWYTYKVSDPIQVFCTVPDKAEIHGMFINNETLAVHPGVYAWNDSYYFFDQINSKVVRTLWNETSQKYVFESTSPKAVTAKEAVTFGYNMLQENPYTFANTVGAAGSVIQLQGIMPYDAADKLCLTPVLNQSLNFEVFYTVPLNAKYFFVFEWRTATGTAWEKIKEFDTTFTTVGSIHVPFSPPNENIIMRVSAYGYTGETRNTYVDATLAVGFSFDKATYGSTANVTPKTYSVLKATGVTYWKNRLVAWGVPEDPTILFTSEVNDPTYFPYPSGSDTFDEPIKCAIPFLDNLLVFTASRLHMLTLSADGLTWSKKVIQNNLTIADWDIHLIQVVKNMVFFRSGNYYYMIVPKSGSTTGELTLAAVSKPLYYYFDKFAEHTKTILDAMFGRNVTLTLKHYYNYLDFEDVHNVYVFQTAEGELLNYTMLYNTVNRNWRVYITGGTGILMSYKQDMTQKGTFCLASPTSTGKIMYQLLQYNPRSCEDFYNILTPCDNPMEVFTANHVWHNWQGVDTGYREHVSNFKKRYRELQFVINNRSNRKLQFYTNFFIDGEQRRNHYKHQVHHNIDPLSPKFGEITIEQVLVDPLIAPGVTTLGSDTNDTEAWELDVSSFPDTSFWKVRFPVSGKGYAPRMLLISQNEKPYELLNMSYIYRALYSR